MISHYFPPPSYFLNRISLRGMKHFECFKKFLSYRYFFKVSYMLPNQNNVEIQTIGHILHMRRISLRGYNQCQSNHLICESNDSTKERFGQTSNRILNSERDRIGSRIKSWNLEDFESNHESNVKIRNRTNIITNRILECENGNEWLIPMFDIFLWAK